MKNKELYVNGIPTLVIKTDDDHLTHKGFDSYGDSISGDFDVAIKVLISDIINLKNNCSRIKKPQIGYLDICKILAKWDKNRGDDWFTQTRKDLWGEAE